MQVVCVKTIKYSTSTTIIDVKVLLVRVLEQVWTLEYSYYGYYYASSTRCGTTLLYTEYCSTALPVGNDVVGILSTLAFLAAVMEQ